MCMDTIFDDVPEKFWYWYILPVLFESVPYEDGPADGSLTEKLEPDCGQNSN